MPVYDLETLQEIAKIMEASLRNYRADERLMEKSIEAAMATMKIIQTQYNIVKTQQEMYFEMEMAQLEKIWEDSDTKWDFDFSHREGINQVMKDAMDAMINETFTMKDVELTLLLESAGDSVDHFQDAVEKFKERVQMYTEKTSASMDLQKQFYTLVEENTDKMKQEQKIFEQALEGWKEKEIQKEGMG